MDRAVSESKNSQEKLTLIPDAVIDSENKICF